MELDEYDRLRELEDEHWRFRGVRALLREAIFRFAPARVPLRLLDAGCGSGGSTAALSDLGLAVGVDAHPRALHWCRTRGLGALARADVQSLPFADASFDVVVSVDVLYHRAVRADSAALAELARVCRPQGVVLLLLASYEWMRSAHDVVVHTARRYTRGRVHELARGAGLVPERISYWNTTLFPAAALYRLLWRGEEKADSDLGRPSAGLNALLSVLLATEARLALRVPLPFGLSVFAVLRRPDPAALSASRLRTRFRRPGRPRTLPGSGRR
jgi:SAM-dependent methyltransferase